MSPDARPARVEARPLRFPRLRAALGVALLPVGLALTLVWLGFLLWLAFVLVDLPFR